MLSCPDESRCPREVGSFRMREEELQLQMDPFGGHSGWTVTTHQRMLEIGREFLESCYACNLCHVAQPGDEYYLVLQVSVN